MFHRGSLGDSILLWPVLRALRAEGEHVALVTDGARAALAARELGIEGIDAEQRRFGALWVDGGVIEAVACAARVIAFVPVEGTPAGRVWASNARRMFPGALIETFPGRLDRPLAVRLAGRFGGLTLPPARSNPTGPVVGHVGAGSNQKRWPLERWRELAERLGGAVILAGEVEGERFTAAERRLFEAMGGRFLANPVDLADRLRSARVFLGGDTGPTHLAAALGVPTVALFGPTDPEVWGPIGPCVRIVRAVEGDLGRLAADTVVDHVTRAGPQAQWPAAPRARPRSSYHAPVGITAVQLKVGLEVHVELATRSKMFSRAANPAHPDYDRAAPNTLIDPVVLGLPGALPVMNKAAIEMAMLVGLALGCRIAEQTKWDRKGYFYPDLPKGYQISQYDLPLCFDGQVDVPAVDEKGFAVPGAAAHRVGIIRAHLEEDAGKLLHEAPGGAPIDFSIVDLNRAGTPLLEIVTQPDFSAVDQVVAFAKMLRSICRFLGVTEGVMQKGHMRFEPNINTILTLDDGRTATTPIVEIKNLNSFKSLKGAIEFELADQPKRWQLDGRVMGKGAKTTRGWDDARGETYVQREKEDAPDYRYFPDPDLVPVVVDAAWREAVRARIPELPQARLSRYVRDYGLSAPEASALTEERGTCLLYEGAIEEMVGLGMERVRAGRVAANLLLQSGARRANERGVPIYELGISPGPLAKLAKLREDGRIGSNAADELFGLLCGGEKPGRRTGGETGPADVETLARERGLLIVRDDAAMERWCDEAIAGNPQAAADVRAGKAAAIGRLVGAAMKASGGSADAKAVREALMKKLSGG